MKSTILTLVAIGCLLNGLIAFGIDDIDTLRLIAVVGSGIGVYGAFSLIAGEHLNKEAQRMFYEADILFKNTEDAIKKAERRAS